MWHARAWQMLRSGGTALLTSLGGSAAVVTRAALIAVIVCAYFAPRLAQAQSLCESCEVEVGAGGTYHFWASTGSLVLPLSVTWDENRYEFGVFRFTTQ
jgi:hypothetical protein